MRRVALVLAVSTVAATAGAAPIVVDAGARTDLALTVYQGVPLAIVRDVRRVNLPAGAATLRVVDVSADLDPRTVSLTTAPGVTVARQRFRWDLASEDALLARWIGKEIELVETDELLQTQTTPATLLALRPRRMVRIGDRLVLDHPGRIQLPLTDPGLVTRPTLEWRLRAPKAVPTELAIDYATTGLTWNADYTLHLEVDETRARLRSWITLTNDGTVPYADARVAVVAGQVNRTAAPPRRIARAAMADFAAEAAPPTESGVLDYRRYDVPGRVSIAPGDIVQVRLFEAPDVPVVKRYVVRSNGDWYGRGSEEAERPVPVRVRLELQNDAASGLGRALPAGTVRVWAPTEEGTPTFAGEDRIAHVAPDRPVRLTVGMATGVQATRRLVEHKRIGQKPYQHESEAEVQLFNRTTRAVEIHIREPMPGTWTVIEATQKHERVDAHTLGFTVTVGPGKDELVRYRVRVGS